jgi:hypothetical protein
MAVSLAFPELLRSRPKRYLVMPLRLLQFTKNCHRREHPSGKKEKNKTESVSGGTPESPPASPRPCRLSAAGALGFRRPPAAAAALRRSAGPPPRRPTAGSAPPSPALLLRIFSASRPQRRRISPATTRSPAGPLAPHRPARRLLHLAGSVTAPLPTVSTPESCFTLASSLAHHAVLPKSNKPNLGVL